MRCEKEKDKRGRGREGEKRGRDTKGVGRDCFFFRSLRPSLRKGGARSSLLRLYYSSCCLLRLGLILLLRSSTHASLLDALESEAGGGAKSSRERGATETSSLCFSRLTIGRSPFFIAAAPWRFPFSIENGANSTASKRSGTSPLHARRRDPSQTAPWCREEKRRWPFSRRKTVRKNKGESS